MNLKYQVTTPKRILIADDEPNLLLSLSFILGDAGYQVTTVENGQEALNNILEQEKNGQPFDLLLSDIQMPDMTGLELMEELSSQGFNLPVIVITGYGDKELLKELLRKGCCDYLDKPLEAKDVLERIVDALIRKKEEEEKREKEFQKIKENHQAQFHSEIESYQNNFVKLQQQIDSAVGTYNKLIDLKKNKYAVNMAWQNLPLNELGGDFVDIRNTSAGCDVLIADVAGHDMGASYHTILIKAFFDENCRTGKDGQSFFRLLNQQLFDDGKNNRMVTALFLRLDLKKMRGELVSAAHPSLIHCRKNIPNPRIYSINSNVLGLMKEQEFEGRSFSISPGDQLFLFTDGLIEAESFNMKKKQKEKLKMQRFSELIKKYNKMPIGETVTHVWEEVLSFCHHKPRDDMLLLGLEIPEHLTSIQHNLQA